MIVRIICGSCRIYTLRGYCVLLRRHCALLRGYCILLRGYCTLRLCIGIAELCSAGSAE